MDQPAGLVWVDPAAGAHAGHAGHADHAAQFRRLFWVMLVIAIPVAAFIDMFAMVPGYALPHAPWPGWISPVSGTVMYAWDKRPFRPGAVSKLKAR